MAKKLSAKAERIKTLHEQLREWRDQQNELRKKVEAARSELKALGEDPDRRFDFGPRNEEIYRRVKLGHSLQEIGEEFGVGKERARQIFQRQEKKLMIQLFKQGKTQKEIDKLFPNVKMDIADSIERRERVSRSTGK